MAYVTFVYPSPVYPYTLLLRYTLLWPDDNDDVEHDLMLAYVAYVYPYVVYLDNNKKFSKH